MSLDTYLIEDFLNHLICFENELDLFQLQMFYILQSIK